MLFAVVADGKFAQLIQSVVYFFLVRRVAEGVLFHIQAVIALYCLEPSVFGFAGLRVVLAGKLPQGAGIAVFFAFNYGIEATFGAGILP